MPAVAADPKIIIGMIKSTLSKLRPSRRTTILLSLAFFIPFIFSFWFFYIAGVKRSLDAAERENWQTPYEIEPLSSYLYCFYRPMAIVALPVGLFCLGTTLAIYVPCKLALAIYREKNQA
ncbi:MAG: hypothetical protein H6677_26370 [Candidatus Obscuribacterales bacterium]|nr:hypothetical protein [Candidatus Obscuribacterales bacterium]